MNCFAIGGCEVIATYSIKKIIREPSTFVKVSIAFPAFLIKKIPMQITELISAPTTTSIPNKTFRPKPQPAIFPILKTIPPANN